MRKIKVAKLLYYIGLTLSMLVGIWHFFVPSMFKWYSYIPIEYENLIVGVDWTNFFFSFLLAGISILLIAFGKKVFSGSKDVLVFYGFIVFTWLCRVAITFIEPWLLNPIAWPAHLQQIVSFIIFVLLLIPLIFLIRFKQVARDVFAEKSGNHP
jgi:hypothetical protein